MGQFDTNSDMLKIIDCVSVNVMQMYKDEKFSKIVGSAIEHCSPQAI